MNNIEVIICLVLLFEVGLEIELPPLRKFIRPLGRATSWALLQYPLAFGLAMLAGLDWLQAFVAAAALTACSVGMADPAWKSYPGFALEPKQSLLHVMVLPSGELPAPAQSKAVETAADVAGANADKASP